MRLIFKEENFTVSKGSYITDVPPEFITEYSEDIEKYLKTSERLQRETQEQVELLKKLRNDFDVFVKNNLPEYFL